MLHLLFTMQELATYKNVIKCDKDVRKDFRLFEFTDVGNFVEYTQCNTSETTPRTYYCASGCPDTPDTTTKCLSTDEPTGILATSDYINAVFTLPEDKYIISFTSRNSKNEYATDLTTKTLVSEDDKEYCKYVDITLNDMKTDKKVFYLITCIMFWVAFLLILATFILAIISVSECGCCGCNSIKSVFPMRNTRAQA
jgi:hypothetical protein